MGKAYKVVYYFLFFFVALIALMLIISMFPVFNFRILAVKSGSMQPAVKTGSIVAVLAAENYKIGDIVTFRQKGKSQELITHRVSEMRVDVGRPVYTTKGDANESSDKNEIIDEDILGKVIFSVPFAGYAIEAAKKPLGFAAIIIIPAFIIICDEAGKIFREVKKIKKDS